MPCAVVFGQDEGKSHYVVLEETADDVGQRIRNNQDGFERFEVKGKALWINVRNVLYIKDRRKGSPRFGSF